MLVRLMYCSRAQHRGSRPTPGRLPVHSDRHRVAGIRPPVRSGESSRLPRSVALQRCPKVPPHGIWKNRR